MTPEQQCALFVRSLSLINVDDDGLTDANDFTDLEALSQVCPEIKLMTAAGNTPYSLGLHRVATLTERILLTWARPDQRAIKEWLLARGELLEMSTGSG